ncbi:hypothetical protein CYLTODRAFT_421663 [Cylindrobasidium torrendii FP15055 ss-10]|uniref:Uncharacterized protein n=1 Tax=Cylindrobasidium torrendii FP15055 ss-10 TaxID=1314674 RepID=A0A0D7BD69_9AGAR|nr:hypothetical protein CYLTODRAFT_421663 [Cylindrobasidium torrendii FP15055 ss-10]
MAVDSRPQSPTEYRKPLRSRRSTLSSEHGRPARPKPRSSLPEVVRCETPDSCFSSSDDCREDNQARRVEDGDGLRRQRTPHEHARRARRHSRSRANDELDALRAEMQKQREYYTSCVSSWQARCEELEASCSKYRTNLDDAERKVRDLQSQLDQEQSKRLDTEQQLDVGRRELQEAHTYLETSDRMSGEDVMGLVRALNSEIFQFAAAIAETRSCREDVLMDKPSLDDLEKFVGTSLVDILRRDSVPGADPEFLLQTAIRVALAKVAHRWTKLFSVSDNSQAEVRAAFDSIRTTSPQSVSARWRSLIYARHKYGDTRMAHAKLCALLKDAVDTVIDALGYTPFDGVEGDISAITDAVFKLDRATGEAALSQNLGVGFAKPAKPYDARVMEDVDCHQRQEEEGTIACCIEVGLYCTVRGQFGDCLSKQWLLKPKIYLESMFYGDFIIGDLFDEWEGDI